MKLVYYISVVVLVLIVISLEEREIRIAQKEAYQDGYRKGLKECHKFPTRPIVLDDSTGDIYFKCSCCGQEYIVPEEENRNTAAVADERLTGRIKPMGCKQICSVDPGIHKCCLECEKYKECNILCDDLDQHEYMEECPDYVKEDEDNENN